MIQTTSCAPLATFPAQRVPMPLPASLVLQTDSSMDLIVLARVCSIKIIPLLTASHATILAKLALVTQFVPHVTLQVIEHCLDLHLYVPA